MPSDELAFGGPRRCGDPASHPVLPSKYARPTGYRGRYLGRLCLRSDAPGPWGGTVRLPRIESWGKRGPSLAGKHSVRLPQEIKYKGTAEWITRESELSVSGSAYRCQAGSFLGSVAAGVGPIFEECRRPYRRALRRRHDLANLMESRKPTWWPWPAARPRNWSTVRTLRAKIIPAIGSTQG